MRRKIPALAVLLAFVCAVSISTGVAQATQTCSDSWGSDGHTGPWYTISNATLHGNTVVITCPNGSVAWSVHYQVQKSSTSGSFFPIDEHRSGNGSTSFSISQSPNACNPAPWVYLTHVHNNFTGGDIFKPNLGQVIC